MAFILFFAEGEDIDFQFVTNKSEAVVTVQLGYDDVTDVTYSLMACLSPVAGAVEGEYDFVFCIIEYDHDEECEYQLWDGRQTSRKIANRTDRDACLWVLREVANTLINEVSPKIVTMFAHSPNLPSKALQKMHMVASVFAQAGFTVGQPDPYNGREIWLMERVS